MKPGNLYTLFPVVAVFVLFAGIFLIFPHIDLTVSHIFFDEQRGFFLARQPVLLFFHYATPLLSRALAVIYLFLLVIWFITRWSPKFLPPLATLYLLATLVIGSGVVIAGVKEVVGRARPDEIVEFHGQKHFSRPLTISGQCTKNCSFPSGHAAVGFYFLSFSFLSVRYRKPIFAAGFAFGCIVALSRIMMGKHYLSDVVSSGYLVYLTSFVLYHYVFFRKKEAS